MRCAIVLSMLFLSGCTMSQFKCLMLSGPTTQPRTTVVSVDGVSHVLSYNETIAGDKVSGAWAQECPAQHYATLIRGARTADDFARADAEMDRWRCENGWDKPARYDPETGDYVQWNSCAESKREQSVRR